jgi:uridylate kinase
MKIVFSIGGSILAPDGIDSEYVKKIAEMFYNLSENHMIAAVVGGGRPARRAIEAARMRGASWAECDHIGVLATRENAKSLVSALDGKSNLEIPESIHDAAGFFGDKILVMGGTEPGHSTDAVAALLGDWVGADLFINASNVDAVYDRNPKKFPDAKPLKKITIDDLISLLSGEGSNAGEYPLLDSVALSSLRRSHLKTLFLDGRNIKNIESALSGGPFKGTTVIF